MRKTIDSQDYRFAGKGTLNLAKRKSGHKKLYDDKANYRAEIAEFHKEINELQRMMYAHNKYSLLLIFQAMDAAGKDGTIRAVMSGINPHGVVVHAFKKPNDNELEHDFLWRTTVRLPQRGKIGIFNRSYYEEVLAVRVHPEILHSTQNLPKELTEDLDQVWEDRYESIKDFEKHLYRNGTRVLKFFLHLGKDEQRDRFLSRIDESDKNWKFSEADIAERAFWDDYQSAYQDAINATATKQAPWYVIPADNKKNMRLIVAQILLEELKALKMNYPKVSKERRQELQTYREKLAK